MNYEFEIDPTRRLIVERWSGEVTLDALVGGLAEIEVHPDFDPGFDVLVDYSQARLGVSHDDLRKFQHVVRSRGWTTMGRRAIIASSDLDFGVARQAQGLWQVDNFAIFRQEDEARRWLKQA